MKTKLTVLLSVVVLFFSCQNEEVNVEENQQSPAEIEITEGDDALTPDGEGDDLIFNEASKSVYKKNTFSLSNKSNSTTDGYYGNTGSGTTTSNCTADLEGFASSLPETISITTTAKPDDSAYFLLDILNTDLAGTGIQAWCIDVDLSLGVEGPLDFDVYSSYEDLPAGKFENPENFDLINWILNQSFVGETSPSGGAYTFGHVQWAMWELIDDRNCQTCTYLTNPIGSWKNDPENITKGQEIVDAALANGEGFVPQCGQQIGIVLVPEGKQSIIISKEVPSIEECSDCEGKVSELELKFNWHYSKNVRIYQKKENSYYAVKVFDGVLEAGETFTIEGANADGTFGDYVYIYFNHCDYYTKIKTNCYLNIGPGYDKGVFEVISGESTQGGELCEYEKPDYSCHRHWSCTGHNYCTYGYSYNSYGYYNYNYYYSRY